MKILPICIKKFCKYGPCRIRSSPLNQNKLQNNSGGKIKRRLHHPLLDIKRYTKKNSL
jgi:hypothetical protein